MARAHVGVRLGWKSGDIAGTYQPSRGVRRAHGRWSKGYAGWAAGQLQSECKRGVWFTAAASPKVVLREVGLADGSEYWHKILGLMGGEGGRAVGWRGRRWAGRAGVRAWREGRKGMLHWARTD